MSNYMSRLADRLVGESSMHAGGSVRKGDGRHGKSSRLPNHASERPLSFLFVVNELNIAPHATVHTDQWGYRLPPSEASDYEGETPGAVYRYRDGEVEVAPEYYWYRLANMSTTTGRSRRGGRIMHFDDEDGEESQMPEYSSYTVFRRSGPLPCLYAAGDVLATRRGVAWQGMSFGADDGSGVTRIVAGEGPEDVVAGQSPSWIPGLVSEVFWNSDPEAPPSRGLGGLLPVILGQMALSQPRGHIDNPFIYQWWHHRRWTPAMGSTTALNPLDARGALVVVALDDFENRRGSTRESLRRFEQGVIVQDEE